MSRARSIPRHTAPPRGQLEAQEGDYGGTGVGEVVHRVGGDGDGAAEDLDLHIDGWCGAAVALFILWSGFGAARETINPLLGQPPSPEFVEQIRSLVRAQPQIIGIHDLIVHDYGPGRRILSLHAEVPASGDILALHDVVDALEKQLNEKLGCLATIHMDPVASTES